MTRYETRESKCELEIANMESEIYNAEHNESGVDAFTAEVIRSALVAITGEMKTNLMRTAYHTIIYEAEDFTVGLFDADGNTISIGLGLPMFIRGLVRCDQSQDRALGQGKHRARRYSPHQRQLHHGQPLESPDFYAADF